MLTAIAAQEAEPLGTIHPHAARAPYYLLYDSNGTLQGVLANPYCEADHAVAPRVAALLAEEGVGALVAGRVGERFQGELAERGIEFVAHSGEISTYHTERRVR
jgi:predicted Fe-Mo cluster-binding NifX family protein